MLKMPQQHYIRFLREAEGCSIQEIADRVGVHWRTAKKYADRDNWNVQIAKRKGRSPVMGPYMEIVDAWLEEDRLLPRKQRHTAARIFQRLRDEHPFPGSERTVSSYVKRRKAEMELEQAKIYERLEHPPAEAQADFTTVDVCRDGKLVSVQAVFPLLSVQQCGLCLPGSVGKPGMFPRSNAAGLPADGRRAEADLVRQSLSRCCAG